MATITFHGAAGTVTGSCHLLKLGRYRFLMDCGQFQGPWELEKMNYERFGFNPKGLTGLILSHGHLDHCGRIPVLYKQGFDGDIYCTPPTRDIAALIMMDSAHILKEEFLWKQRRLTRAGIKVKEPLYSVEDVFYAHQLFTRQILYDKPVEPVPGVKLTFKLREAGHILGASQVVVEFKEKKSRKWKKILYTGDIGDGGRPMVNDPAGPEQGIDALIMESTYGDRDHRSYEDSVLELEEAITTTVKRRGTVLIPTFALERTQEILYHIAEMKRSGKLSKRVPVFLNSPLAINITRLYEKHRDFCQVFNDGRFSRRRSPFDMPNLKFTETVEESKAIHNVAGPKIVLAGSGMMTGGRIKHHLKHNLWKENTTLIVVGFQAMGTLGRKLVDGAKEVRIFGEPVAVRARIYTINGFSAHADRSNLIQYAKAARPEKLFIVHGEPHAQGALRKTLAKLLPHTEIYLPRLGESFRI